MLMAALVRGVKSDYDNATRKRWKNSTYVAGITANSVGITVPPKTIQVVGSILFQRDMISLTTLPSIKCAVPLTFTTVSSMPTMWWWCCR